MLEQDACNRLSETLQEQVERFVIRYVTGDDEPLAHIVIAPVSKQNVDEDIKIDQHLVSLGAKLSKNDALQRYGRTEADPEDPEDAPLSAPQPQPGLGGFANEVHTPSGTRPLADEQPTLSNPTQGESGSNALLEAFASDTGAAAEAVKRLLENPTPEGAAALLKDLPSLIPEDPALAAVIAEAMAAEFCSVPSAKADGMENEDQPRGKTSPESTPGSFAPAGSDESASSEKNGEENSSGYTVENRSQIGKSGDWKSLGLPAMRDIPADPPIVFNKIEESTARILAGETVVNPFGETLKIDKGSLSHINKKGRSPKQLQDKLQTLDAAEETARHPHEIWQDESNGVRIYVRITQEARGRRVVNACDEHPNHLYSWHTSPISYDHWRRGKLLWIRK